MSGKSLGPRRLALRGLALRRLVRASAVVLGVGLLVAGVRLGEVWRRGDHG